jgi:hypothetical protein
MYQVLGTKYEVEKLNLTAISLWDFLVLCTSYLVQKKTYEKNNHTPSSPTA